MSETNVIDFNHWLGSEIGNQLLVNAQEARWLQIISNLKPTFGKEGGRYYYMINTVGVGEPDCIIGYGDTPYKAMVDFCRCFENGSQH